MNTEYQVAQTKKQEFQGVWILTKDMDIKIEWEDQQTGWFLVCLARKEFKIWAYLTGVYRKVEWKEETTQEKNKIIKRIRRKHLRISIIIFGDMNTKGKDSIDKLEKMWKLKCNINNKILITRTQMIKDKWVNSTLDFWKSTNNITSIERIEMKGRSDHFPVLAEIEVSSNPRMNKAYRMKKINRHPTKEQTIELFKTGWPLINTKNNLSWLKYTSIIRPKLFISAEKSKVFERSKWEKALKGIKLITEQEYREFIEEVNQ